MITFETIEKETIYIAKMQGWRATGTWDEIGYLAKDEDCREFDVCATQPTKELQEFHDAHYEYIIKNDFIFAKDFYPIYVKMNSGIK